MPETQKAEDAPVLCIAGPTASGKSALALDMALRFDAEIVSVDSMQLYKGIDIGSAKPDKKDRETVRHHLLDIFSISENVTVASFCAMAREAMAEIRSRGKKIILCGGSGLYMKTLIYGMDDLPAAPCLRAELEKEFYQPETIPALRQKLIQQDPAAADLPSTLSLRRLLRLLEITLLQGKLPPTDSRGERPAQFPAVLWVLQWEREQLKARIKMRAEEMLAAGWIEEASQLLAMGLLETPTAHQAIGYKQIADYLAGSITRETLVEQIATRTWQFARRQQTWFKHQHPDAEFITMPVPPEYLQTWPQCRNRGKTFTE